MKNIIIVSLAALSMNLNAHMIEGTLMLKGAIKTKIRLNGIKTTCKVKVEKVKNLLVEDSFGNPAYDVKINVDLSGSDYQRGVSVNFDRDFRMINLFTIGNGTEVRDLEYFSNDGASLKIDKEGRVKSIAFPYNYQTISCVF
jgi:hypothetical protein